jgi:hypothetical protein
LHLVPRDRFVHRDWAVITEETDDNRLDGVLEFESKRAHTEKVCRERDNATHLITIVLAFVTLSVV